MRGLHAVQRLNARENVAGSENPTRYAVSFTETFFPLKEWSAILWRNSANTFWRLTPSALKFRQSVWRPGPVRCIQSWKALASIRLP